MKSQEDNVTSQLSGKQMVTWKRKLAYIAIMTVCCFFILEGIARLIPFEPQSDPLLLAFVNPEWKDKRIFELDMELFWKFRPNQLLKCQRGDEHYNIIINNLGFRGRNLPDRLSSNDYRVMFLGDSCVFGWDAAMNTNFPERLKSMLSERYKQKKFDIFQGAVPGYSSYQCRRVFDLYSDKYRPSMVVVFLGTNDNVPSVNYPDSIMMQMLRFDWKLRSLLENSKFYLFARDFSRKARISKKHSPDSISDTVQNTYPRVPIREFRENIRYIVDSARMQFGSEIVLLTRHNLKTPNPLGHYNDHMRKIAAEKNTLLVDFDRWFSSQPNPAQYLTKPESDPIHPNELGYNALSELVFQAIESGQLIR